MRVSTENVLTFLFVVAAAAISVGALILAVQPAHAAEGCGDRKAILHALADRYDEAPVAAGVASNGIVVEVLTSPDGKSWTIVASNPDGTSCLLAAGDDWQNAKTVDPEKGDDL